MEEPSSGAYLLSTFSIQINKAHRKLNSQSDCISCYLEKPSLILSIFSMLEHMAPTCLIGILSISYVFVESAPKYGYKTACKVNMTPLFWLDL